MIQDPAKSFPESGGFLITNLEYFYEMSSTSVDNPAPSGGDLRGLFREHGLRCTRQRERIYTALAGTKSHPTAEELHISLRDDEGGLSLATVYNTLEAFTDKGLCRRLPAANGSGACRFDADLSHHAHIVLDDGRVLDVPSDLSERIARDIPRSTLDEIERRLGVEITGTNLHLAGRAVSRPE